jgi:predicted RNase H-like HicB family nuclease
MCWCGSQVRTTSSKEPTICFPFLSTMERSSRIMSAKRKDVQGKGKAINRPVDSAVLKRARQIADRYQVVISHEDGEYYGRGLELPGAMDDGTTPDECVTNTREAMVAMVAYMLEEGRTPPAPALEGARTEQVNVRLTAEEKLAMEQAAQRQGYRGLSDYVRAAALAGMK